MHMICIRKWRWCRGVCNHERIRTSPCFGLCASQVTWSPIKTTPRQKARSIDLWWTLTWETHPGWDIEQRNLRDGKKNNRVGRSWSTNGQFDRDLVCNYMHLPALWKHQWSSFTIHMHLCLIKYLQDETHPCFSSIWVCHGLSKNKISSPKSSGSTSFSQEQSCHFGL
jgi:hypothetical protein